MHASKTAGSVLSWRKKVRKGIFMERRGISLEDASGSRYRRKRKAGPRAVFMVWLAFKGDNSSSMNGVF